MENNQQRQDERIKKGNNEATAFTNQQPGQQLPSENKEESSDQTHDSGSERHSESSMPEKGNETLGRHEGSGQLAVSSKQ